MEILQSFERGFQGLIIPLAVQNVSITKIYSFDMFKQIWLIWYDRKDDPTQCQKFLTCLLIFM